ncbi:MAG: metal-dependent transcriptional regulator [Bacteroidia bacterium]|nr:metal-dependent transcriptional regulator [Bacteroidia bacterium]
MNSLVEENYLKALFNLANEKGEVSVNDLSKSLEIKMPTVNSMMKKLSEKNLVHYESYKPLKLTDLGRKESALIIRKHRLTEMFLVEKMGFGWEQVHEIAEQVEHIQSPLLFDKMDKLLGFPKIDPHGSPIPDKNGKIQGMDYVKLSTCIASETITLAAITHSSNEFLKFLNSRDLSLGVKIKIRSVESFDGSMTVSYGKRTSETLSHVVCEKLLVLK